MVLAHVAAELDDDMLESMGYRIGPYALGDIDDCRDPLEAVRGPRATAGSVGAT